MGQQQAHQIDENLITISTDQPAREESAVLSAVKQREVELKTELLKARQTADDILADARSKAAAIKDTAATSGQDKAGKLIENELAAVKAETAKTANETPAAVQAITVQGQKNLKQAIAFVIEVVLPQSAKEAKNVLDNDKN